MTKQYTEVSRLGRNFVSATSPNLIPTKCYLSRYGRVKFGEVSGSHPNETPGLQTTDMMYDVCKHRNFETRYKCTRKHGLSGIEHEQCVRIVRQLLALVHVGSPSWNHKKNSRLPSYNKSNRTSKKINYHTMASQYNYPPTVSATPVACASQPQRLTSNPPPGAPDGGQWGKVKYAGDQTNLMCCILCLVGGIFTGFGTCAYLCPIDEKDGYRIGNKVSASR